MDLITSIVRAVMHYRVRAIRRYATDYESIQRKTLRRLVRQASGTSWGKQYGYASIRSYADYAYMRTIESGALKPLQVIVARQGLFYEWLESKGKLGGQQKVPRLSHSRDHINQLLALN